MGKKSESIPYYIFQVCLTADTCSPENFFYLIIILKIKFIAELSAFRIKTLSIIVKIVRLQNAAKFFYIPFRESDKTVWYLDTHKRPRFAAKSGSKNLPRPCRNSSTMKKATSPPPWPPFVSGSCIQK